MNVNRRDSRVQPGGSRGAAQRAPRSGGRTTVESRAHAGKRVAADRTAGSRDAGVAAAQFRTQGTAALRVERARPQRDAAAAPRLQVAPPPPVRVPGTSFVALILVLVVAGVLGVVVVNTKINENALRLAQLEKQQAALDLDQQQLQQAITDAQAPGNLTAKARQLGLVESGPPTYIRLSDGRVIGVPQPGNGQAGAAGSAGD
ncbi:hypothetical protein [Melissospora conviva]|uniref:hypothetical protein n=1 Tax=Melissospora conviva TaxID=3388432 RepID=UPI003C1A4EDD